MERIAIPTFQSHISPVLDACRDLIIVDLAGERVVRRTTVSLGDITHLERASAISRRGVQKIICAGVSKWMLACLVNRGMHVISGVTGEVEQIIAGYQKGLLDQDRFRMPGGKKAESSMLRVQATRPA
jgi:predicted Fe-Mo cluster-binding NifX family protein